MQPELTAILKLNWVRIQHWFGRPENEIKLDVSPAEADYLYRVAIRNGWRALAVSLLAARTPETGKSCLK
jgi:hypothetical protein